VIYPNAILELILISLFFKLYIAQADKYVIEGFEVLTAVDSKNTIFRDITSCSQLKVNGRFRGTFRFHLQGFLLGIFFDPEDGSDMFRQNVC
jgi:hypothetical protein